MTIQDRIGKYLQAGRSWYTRDVKTITVFSIHHSASLPLDKTNDQMLEELAQDHYKQGWPGLSYHFVITPDGSVFQINNDNQVTWIDSINWDCLGICIVGYFHPPYNQQPTDKQLQSLRELLDDLSTNHPEFPADEGDAYGHRERFATACPGDILFPYVLDYRAKLGVVDWGKEQVGKALPPVQGVPGISAEQTTPIQTPIPPSTTSSTNADGTLKYTQAQYEEIVRELDEAKQISQDNINANNLTSKNYSGFVAMGYNTVDDLQKVIKQKDDESLGLQKQIIQLKTSRATLLDQFKAVDQEDATALDIGVKAETAYKALKADYDAHLVALGVKKRNLFHVLSVIENLKSMAARGVQVLERDKVKNTQQDPVRGKVDEWMKQINSFFPMIMIFVIGIFSTLFKRG